MALVFTATVTPYEVALLQPQFDVLFVINRQSVTSVTTEDRVQDGIAEPMRRERPGDGRRRPRAAPGAVSIAAVPAAPGVEALENTLRMLANTASGAATPPVHEHHDPRLAA